MKKYTKLAGIASVAFLIAGCQDSEENAEGTNTESTEESAENENETEGNGSSESPDEAASETDENDSNENPDEPANEAEEDTGSENTEESTHETDEDDSITYAGTQETPHYFIGSHYIESEEDDITQSYTAFSIARDEEAQLSYEDRIEKSLINEDPSEQDILNSYTDLAADWPKLDIYFKEEGNELSTTSAQSGLFYDSLFGISDLYGIEEISFFNPEGEQDIIVAERGVKEPIIVKDERGVTRGYYTIYDTDREETLFLAGGDVEEQVENDQGDPLSFSDTVEAMKTVDHEDAFYSSAMVEGIEIGHTSMTDNRIATVQYTMDEDIVTEADRIVFERAMQLTALDFHAWEIRLVNDTTEEFITYPLVGNE